MKCSRGAYQKSVVICSQQAQVSPEVHSYKGAEVRHKHGCSVPLHPLLPPQVKAGYKEWINGTILLVRFHVLELCPGASRHFSSPDKPHWASLNLLRQAQGQR